VTFYEMKEFELKDSNGYLKPDEIDPWRSRGCLNGVHFLPASL